MTSLVTSVKSVRPVNFVGPVHSVRPVISVRPVDSVGPVDSVTPVQVRQTCQICLHLSRPCARAGGVTGREPHVLSAPALRPAVEGPAGDGQLHGRGQEGAEDQRPGSGQAAVGCHGGKSWN